METTLKTNFEALKANYNRLLGDHESMKCYLAKKTSKSIEAGNEVILHAKNFAKALKLSGFSNRMGEVRRIKVDRKECKAKYVISKSPPMSPLPEIVEKEKLSLFDIDLDDEAIPCLLVMLQLLFNLPIPQLNLGELMLLFHILCR